MTGQEFLRNLAEQLAFDLAPNEAIKRFTGNSELIGAFAEASVRALVARVVAPLQVSRGSIIYEGNCPDNVPEIDTIVWFPCPVPAVFQAGDFALVPRGSAVAFLEIKRSNYSGVGSKIARCVTREDELIPWNPSGETAPNAGPCRRALGVICIKEQDRVDGDLEKLIEDKRVVVLLERTKNSELKARPQAMFDLVNFLMGARKRAKLLEGQPRVNWQD